MAPGSGAAERGHDLYFLSQLSIENWLNTGAREDEPFPYAEESARAIAKAEQRGRVEGWLVGVNQATGRKDGETLVCPWENPDAE